MNILFLILLLSTNFMIGYGLASIFHVSSGVERVGIAFLLGTGATTLFFFWTYVLFGFSFTTQTVIIVHLFLLMMIGAILKITSPKGFQVKEAWNSCRRILWQLFFGSLVVRLLLAMIILLVSTSFFLNYVRPITDWDAIALYDFRAKVMIAETNWNTGFDLGYFFQYPPYTSLLHAMNYALGIPQAKVWYSAIYFSFLITFYALLHRRLSFSLSLIGMAFLAVSPLIFEHAMVAYTNLAYVTFLCVGIIYLYYWTDEHKSRDLLLGTLLVGLTTWIRMSEPFWMIGLVLIGWGWMGGQQKRKNTLKIGYALSLFLGLRAIWFQYIKYLTTTLKIGMSEEVTQTTAATVQQEPSSALIWQLAGVWGTYAQVLNQSIPTLLSHLLAVSQYLVAYVLPTFGCLVLPVTIGLIGFGSPQKIPRFIWCQILTIAFLLLLIFGGTLIFSFTFATWNQIGGSASRMVMFLPPLFIFLLMQSPLWQLQKK